MTYVADHEPSAAAVEFLARVGAARIDLSSDLARKHNLRAVPRVALELHVRPVNGASIAGMRYRHGVSVAEVYVDQIGRDLLDRIATQAHRDAYAVAERQCANDTAEWRKEHAAKIKALRARGGGDAAVAEWEARECNLRPEHYLLSMGYRHGIPPIERASVVHPTARDASGEPLRLDVHDFVALDREAAAEWTLPAFVTPASAQERANEHLAATISRAIAAASEGRGARK